MVSTGAELLILITVIRSIVKYSLFSDSFSFGVGVGVGTGSGGHAGVFLPLQLERDSKLSAKMTSHFDLYDCSTEIIHLWFLS